MNEAIRWLLVEGIAALFGAGGLYILVGICFRIAGSAVPFAWREALDPMGWLYGAVVISIQSAVTLFNAAQYNPAVAANCMVMTTLCCLLLVAGMHQRGINRQWTPPRSMKLAAGLLALITLCLGFIARGGI